MTIAVDIRHVLTVLTDAFLVEQPGTILIELTLESDVSHLPKFCMIPEEGEPLSLGGQRVHILPRLHTLKIFENVFSVHLACDVAGFTRPQRNKTNWSLAVHDFFDVS